MSSAAIRDRPPPRWLMQRIVDPYVRRLAGSPASWLAGPASVLRFTGRRSGRPLAVPVLTHEVAGQTFVFTDASWRHNFFAGRALTVADRHGTRAAIGVLVDDIEAARALRSVLSTVPPRRLGLVVRPGSTPSDADLVAVRGAIRLTFQDARRSSAG